MDSRPRLLLLALAALLGALVLAGCGGGGDSAGEDTSVDELLQKTFSGEKEVDSGKLDLSLKIDLREGADAQLQGPVSVRLSGPFQTQGEGKLPEFAMDAAFEGAGQRLQAGLTSADEKAFVNFQGTDYAVSEQVYRQFKAGYEEAQKRSAGKDDQQSLATLGIDPRRWLTDARNAGEAKVGDTDTIKITGGVDVEKLLDDVNTALEKARGLGVEGSDQLPEKLTDEQKRQAADAIKDLAVEIYTGKDDTTLRRMLVTMGVESAQGGQTTAGTLSLDFQLLELNEDQSIEAPSGAKPFDELLGQLGGLGLGGGAGAGAGGGSGSSGGSGSGGASAEDLKKYSDCVTEAGSDTAKAQKCADLLSP